MLQLLDRAQKFDLVVGKLEKLRKKIELANLVDAKLAIMRAPFSSSTVLQKSPRFLSRNTRVWKNSKTFTTSYRIVFLCLTQILDKRLIVNGTRQLSETIRSARSISRRVRRNFVSLSIAQLQEFHDQLLSDRVQQPQELYNVDVGMRKRRNLEPIGVGEGVSAAHAFAGRFGPQAVEFDQTQRVEVRTGSRVRFQSIGRAVRPRFPHTGETGGVSRSVTACSLP